MKFWILLLIVVSALVGCDKKDPYSGKTEGAGGAGPGYDGTGSGPAATNVNRGTNSDTAK